MVPWSYAGGLRIVILVYVILEMALMTLQNIAGSFFQESSAV